MKFIDGSQGTSGPYRHGTVWPGTQTTDSNKAEPGLRKRGIGTPCGTVIF